LLLSVWLCIGVSAALAVDPLPEIAGVFGLESSGDEAWLAVKLAVPENAALAGVTWYNNDGSTLFPRILAGTGYATNPGLVEEFVVVATDVSGPSSAWTEVTFDLPVAASLSDLYVAFELPAEVILTARGMGGGPAIGYVAGEGGLPGWLSGEGEIWAQLHEDYSFAVLPQFVEREEGMLVKSLGEPQIEAVPDGADVDSDYLAAGPNPFNPLTEIRFGLTREQVVRLDVFDIRGRLVVRLLDGVQTRGHHQATWQGQDGAGRAVASGVYVAQLKAEDATLTQRLVLVR
jgi:hypothetical protein